MMTMQSTAYAYYLCIVSLAEDQKRHLHSIIEHSRTRKNQRHLYAQITEYIDQSSASKELSG